jgi:hypothetical protein
MTRSSSSETPTSEGRDEEPGDRLRLVLDDATAERLRAAAGGRHVAVELLMADLLSVASHHVDEVLALRDGVGDGGDSK